MQQDVIASLTDIVGRLSKIPSIWTLSRLAEVSWRHAQLMEQKNAAYQVVPDGLLCEPLVARVCDLPSHLAVITPEMRFTYAELHGFARGLAFQLLQATPSVTPNTCYGIMLSKSGWMPIAAHAIHFVSGAYVPIDPVLPELRIKSICEDAQISVMCTSDSYKQKLFPDDVAVVLVASTTPLYIDVLPVCRQASTDMAYVIFTSGSTGR